MRHGHEQHAQSDLSPSFLGLQHSQQMRRNVNLWYTSIQSPRTQERISVMELTVVVTKLSMVDCFLFLADCDPPVPSTSGAGGLGYDRLDGDAPV